MIEAIRLSAAGARAQSLRHDVIANNLANVNTVGFRRQLALIGAEMARAGTTASQTAPVVAATLPTGGQGPLVPTERSGDLALDGEGYFVVSDGADKFYTRAGQFDVDEAGRLVTADHRFQVQDAGGVGVVVDPTVPFAVTGAGDVLQNGTLVAQLGVVTFRRPEALRPAGGGLWTAAGGEQPAPTGGAVVRQGYLEGSTVDAVRELVSMLEAFRAYEANLNLIASQDATLRRLVSEAARGV